MIVVGLTSCNGIGKQDTRVVNAEAKENNDDERNGSEATHETKDRDPDQTVRYFSELVAHWNQAINLRDQSRMEYLFGPIVFFYTKELPGKEAARQKVETASSDPSWSQQIISDVEVEKLDDGSVKTSFTKQSQSKNGTHTYRAYLVWKKFGDGWKIRRESDLLTDKNVRKKDIKIPSYAIRGDFDGDGMIDNLWMEALYDDDCYIIGKAKLRSDNEALDGRLAWEATRGVILINLGRLTHRPQDFLGAMPDYDSNWESFFTYVYYNGRWKELISPFTIWEGNEDYYRVVRPRSGRKDYVGIYFNNMEDPDNGFENSYKELKVNL